MKLVVVLGGNGVSLATFSGSNFGGACMIHYSCDRCKRDLDPVDAVRYVVKVDAYPSQEPVETAEHDDDRDHLLELHEALENLDDEMLDEILDGETSHKQTYDLCAECYRKFVKNPLGVELATQLNFSDN